MSSASDVDVWMRSGVEEGAKPAPACARPLELGAVARTLLIPLWARSEEMNKRHPLVHDPRAREICEQLDFDFSIFRRAYGTQIGCVLRGLLYDHWVASFLEKNPEGTVVELGAGLSTRFERIDNGRARWVDVDLPDAMALRRMHFVPSSRRHFVPISVTDPTLTESLAREITSPCIFVSEGMLMYLPEADVRGLLVRLADSFGPTEILLDAISPAVVRNQSLHDTMKHMMDAPFRWGVDDIGDIERWDPRLRVLESATLPDIAARFRDRVPRRHRLLGALVQKTMPRFARAYRIHRLGV